MMLGLGLAITGGGQGAGFTHFIDPDSGSDSNDGRSIATAFQTLSAVTPAAGVRVGLKPSSINRGSLALSAAGMAIAPWTAGTRAAIWNSVRHSTGWTQVGATTEWKKTLGYTALNVFRVATDVIAASVTKYILGTVTALTAGQFGVSGNDVFIYAATDPNGLLFEIPTNTVPSTLDASAASITATNLDLWFGPANGLEVSGGSNFTGTGLNTSYNSNDGIGVHNATSNCRLRYGVAKRNGQTRTLVGGAGDGVSFHQTTTGQIVGYDIQDNEKSGISNQARTVVDTFGCFLKNNNSEFMVLNEGSADGGIQRIVGNVIVWASTNSATNAIECCQSDVANPPTVKIYNNVLYRTGGTSKTGIRVNDALVEAKNNIIANFNRGIDWRSTDAASSSLANDYNCMYNNTTAYFNNGTPGVSAGAHDITSDPLFTNAGSEDFTLQAGSLCRNAGVNVGSFVDRAGVPFGDPPDIGAYETA